MANYTLLQTSALYLRLKREIASTTATNPLYYVSGTTDYIQIISNLPTYGDGATSGQVHHVSFVDETIGREFQCTFTRPYIASPGYTVAYYDGEYEIRITRDETSLRKCYLTLWQNGTQVPIGSHTLSAISDCKYYSSGS